MEIDAMSSVVRPPTQQDVHFPWPSSQQSLAQHPLSEIPKSRPARYPWRLRRNSPRFKTGCLTCRLRRKKCDETRPICTGCHRNKRHCSWPPPPEGHIEIESRVDYVNAGDSAGEQQVARYTDTDSVSHSISSNVTSPNDSDATLFSIRSPFELAVLSSQAESYLIRDYPPQSQPFSLEHRARRWSLQLSFPSENSKAILLKPSSHILFEQFIAETATQLVATPSEITNPYINYVLPLAFSDDLIMNCVLALGGAHLCYDNALNLELVSATWSHYSLVLRDFQTALSTRTYDHGRGNLHLLLIALLLCWFETISGDTKGTAFHHLEASRQLILLIRSNPSDLATTERDNLWGFLLEMYSYLILVASVTPRGKFDDRTINLDSFLASLGVLGQYNVYGVMFSGGRELFEIIPDISQFAFHRQADDTDSIWSGERYNEYKRLEGNLRAWKAPREYIKGTEGSCQQIAAATVYQNALLIFLHTSFSRSIQTDQQLLTEVDIRVEASLPLLLSLSLSSVGTNMLWPAIIIGSCSRQDWQRDILREGFLGSKFKMSSVRKGLELLELLWSDSDERAYGPRGLDFVMKKQGISFSMS